MLEQLESRQLLTVSPESQHFIYLLNQARHDPAAFMRQWDIKGDSSQLVPRAPLAVNETLTDVAQRRSLALNGGAQPHPVELWPNDELRQAGYALPDAWGDQGNFVETRLAATKAHNNLEALKAFWNSAASGDPLPLRHLLGIDEVLAENREIGVGHALGDESLLQDYWNIEIARTDHSTPLLTGVVYNDVDHDGQLDVGEGLPGVTINAGNLHTITNAGGGWSLEVGAGDFVISAQGPGWQKPSYAAAHVQSDNIEIDFIAGQQRGIVSFVIGRNSLRQEDVNADQRVNALDAISLVSWLQHKNTVSIASLQASPALRNVYPDVNGDARVNAFDLISVVSAIVRPTSSSPVSVAAPTQNAAPTSTATSASALSAEAERANSPRFITEEELVNTFIPRLQSTAAGSVSVATNARGDSVVVFAGRGPEDRDGVYAQRYGPGVLLFAN